MPFWRQLKALRAFHTGPELLRDAGGPVTRIRVGPARWVPQVVVTTSPKGAHDVLSTSAAIAERNAMHAEMRKLIGANLFDAAI